MPRPLAITTVLLTGLVLTGLVATTAFADPSMASLRFEDRVAAQRAIEEVYWRHRIWPKENSTVKPPLDAVMPDSAIRAKVEDHLAKSTALASLWQRPISGKQLQAELDRMAQGTRNPQLLNELFDALGRDPLLIAETLGRGALADRLTRNWYSGDERFHGALAQKAAAALNSCADIACLQLAGAEYHEATSKYAEIASLQPTPMGQLGTLRETAEAFVITVVLSRRADETVIATPTWPKRPFDGWWASVRATFTTAIEPAAGSFTLPAIRNDDCTNDTWSPTRHDFFPDPREYDSAVWTGTELIVWGGYDVLGISSGALNTGGRYDPATDTWTPTSTGAGVPSERFDHTAVWTGTEMIVWGGTPGILLPQYLDTGGRYDPLTDTWTPTSTGASVPTGRSTHTAVWTGTEMIVWGGTSSLSTPLDSGARYDPIADTWTPTSSGANLPTGRNLHTAVWTGDEMIVWGGDDVSVFSTRVNSGGRYDPATDSWEATSVAGAVPASRRAHTAVWVGDEMVVWGGDGVGDALNSGGRYDPGSDTWTPTSTGAAVPAGRADHTAVWTGDEMIVWGGYDVLGLSSTALDTGGRYDPVNDAWTPTSGAGGHPAGRGTHHAVWTGDEMIIWGGISGWPSNADVGGRYDPAMDSWVPIAGVPLARAVHTAVWTGTEMIVWGGVDGGQPLNSGGRYDAAIDDWAPTGLGANVPAPRVHHTAIWTGTEMLVWGGSGFDDVGDSGGRYNSATNAWQPISVGGDPPAARSLHTAVWTGTEMIIWGGSDSFPLPELNTGSRYNPTTDSWMATSTAAGVPAGRWAHTATWTGAEMLIWGGFTQVGSGSDLDDGARFDPGTNSWAPMSTGANAPSARASPTAVWTGTRLIVWGGHIDDGTQYLDTGGLYDPIEDTWEATSTGAAVPAERAHHSAVWTGTEMIVWGGYSDLGPRDTGGRYDPIAAGWTATSMGPNLPGARSHHSAVWTGTELLVWGGEPPTSTGGRYCACPGGGIRYLDADGDGYGSAAISIASCNGATPVGYAANSDDCDDNDPDVHPGRAESCNLLDDDCNGLVDDGAVGDLCNLDDGKIFQWRTDDFSVTWQAEQGPNSWNVYIGDLDVLRSTGVYSQTPGSNALARRHCAVIATSIPDTVVPGAGKVSFSLIAGVTNGVEGSLGDSTTGSRPNANPCP